MQSKSGTKYKWSNIVSQFDSFAFGRKSTKSLSEKGYMSYFELNRKHRCLPNQTA